MSYRWLAFVLLSVSVGVMAVIRGARRHPPLAAARALVRVPDVEPRVARRVAEAVPVTVRCVSCGWTEDAQEKDLSILGANHLRVCPHRDDLTLLPWWTTSAIGSDFEVGWHPLNINEPYEMPTYFTRPGEPATRRIVPSHRYRFTEYCDREIIGVKAAA